MDDDAKYSVFCILVFDFEIWLVITNKGVIQYEHNDNVRRRRYVACNAETRRFWDD